MRRAEMRLRVRSVARKADRGGWAVGDGLLGGDVVEAHGRSHQAADEHHGPLVDILGFGNVFILWNKNGST